MPKKLTLEFVKFRTKELTGDKYECLSNEYINNNKKLLFICDKEHQFLMRWNDFQQNRRCPICKGIKASKTKRLTIKYIRNKIDEIAPGYKCLSKEYINNTTKLDLKCINAHIYKGTWGNFQRGHRCPICAGCIKKNIEKIKEYTESFGYKCLSEKYVNSQSKLKLQCFVGHIYNATWGHFQRGERCPICAVEGRSGENHPDWKNYTEEDRKDIVLYRAEVVQLTNINYKKYFYLINPNKLKRSYYAYHLDHIYSVIDGFNNNVSPEIIASPINLQMLTRMENGSKNGTSHMTLDQLYDLHNQFITSIGSENN